MLLGYRSACYWQEKSLRTKSVYVKRTKNEEPVLLHVVVFVVVIVVFVVVVAVLW